MDEWLKNGKYLPEEIRDFHDQKDLFKGIHENVKMEDSYTKDITWAAGHCYVIDIFLWFMAKRGYTLQKSRKNLKFRSLSDDIKMLNQARMSRMDGFLTPRVTQ